MYRIYLVTCENGTFPYLTDGMLDAEEAHIAAAYPTRQQAWAHLLEMPMAWAPRATAIGPRSAPPAHGQSGAPVKWKTGDVAPE